MRTELPRFSAARLPAPHPLTLVACALLCAGLAGCATPAASAGSEAPIGTAEASRQPTFEKKPANPSANRSVDAIKNELKPAESDAMQFAAGGAAAAAAAASDGSDGAKARKAAEAAKLIPGTGVFVKPAPPAVAAAAGGAITINFEGADLREVIRVMLGDMLKENYTVDPRVNGTVTIHTSQPVGDGAIRGVLETVLRMNGAAMVREGGVVRVAPIATALRGGAVPQVGNQTAPGYGVQIVPLRFIAAREMAKILEPLVPEGSILRVDETRNLLMIAGSEAERRQAQDTVAVFDVDWLSGMSVGLFSLQSVSVKDILPELEIIFGDKSKSPFGGMVRVIPIERMNALFVATPQPHYLEQARQWVERLDRNGAKSGTRLFVYPVQNGKAERIAALLSQVLGDGKTTSATTKPQLAPGLTGTTLSSAAGSATTGLASAGGTASGGGLSSGTGNLPAAAATAGAGTVASGSAEALGLGRGSSVKVIADPDNNALLIMANAAEYEKIEEAIKRLDVVPRQVLVEVTIAEVTLTGALNYGLEWFFSGNNGVTGMLFNSDSNYRALPSDPSGTVTPRMPFSAVWRGSTGNIKAVLSALANNTKVNIISSPHIMVTDNQVARINVGASVPVQGQSTITGTTASTAITTSVQYVDTGVLLSVRPHINAGGLVNLEINQEVSDVQPGVTTQGLNSPTINKRSAQTTVAVQSGDTMVLGGLIKDDKSDGSSGLPGLSEIPILGALFGTKTQSNTRRELLITITPRVVEDTSQAREVTAEFRKKLSGLRSIQDSMRAVQPPSSGND